MKKAFSYFAPYKKECVLAPLLKLLEALLELFIPILVADIIDRGVNGGDKTVILTDILIMVGLGILGLAFSICGQYFSAKAAVGFSSGIRSDLYKKLLKLPLTETDKLGSAKMITRMTSDVGKVQSGVNLALRLLLRSPFVVMGAFVASFIIDKKISIIFAVAILILAIIVAVIMKITMPMHSKSQKLLDDVGLTARENLTGVRVIRAFGGEDEEVERYEKENSALEKFQVKAGWISSLLNPMTFVVVNIAIVVLLYFGGVEVEVGILSQGAIIALYDYLSQILVELIKFANLVVSISKALASGKRITDILETEEEKLEPNKEDKNTSFIEYKGVCSSYGGGEVLTDINLKIERGQTVGVIGGTGSGKSTLINLLTGIYKPTKGVIYLDGKDVNSYTNEQLSQKVAVALQKPTLFKGTIKSNILLGKENATDKEILKAIEVAQAENVISVKEDGINSVVEQGGRNFSGGQRQRLSLARAIVKNSAVLVLDDSSSALDFVTDLNLRRALKNQEGDQTVIIISQRTASIKDADKIIVLDDGEIVGEGTHQYLYQNCEVYREIEDSQKGGEQ
ncbi:MAG: ABC transporter ATP-binding protein [Clostridiales bacterium]|nr:ABC transporter ATP-binding protein [Clostridiales bacterium]